MNKKNYLWISKLMVGIYLIPALIWGAPPKDPPAPHAPNQKPKPVRVFHHAPDVAAGNIKPGMLPTDPVDIGYQLNTIVSGASTPTPTYRNPTWDAFSKGDLINNPTFRFIYINDKLGGRPFDAPGNYIPPKGVYTFPDFKKHLGNGILALIKKHQIDVNIPLIVSHVDVSFLAKYYPPTPKHPQGFIVIYPKALNQSNPNAQGISMLDMVVFHELMHFNIRKHFYEKEGMLKHFFDNAFMTYGNYFTLDAWEHQRWPLLSLYQEIEIHYREYLIWKYFEVTGLHVDDMAEFQEWAKAEMISPESLKIAIINSMLKKYGPLYFPDHLDIITSENFINDLINSDPPEYVTLPW